MGSQLNAKPPSEELKACRRFMAWSRKKKATKKRQKTLGEKSIIKKSKENSEAQTLHGWQSVEGYNFQLLVEHFTAYRACGLCGQLPTSQTQ